jgi:hypothetical protein
MRRLHLFEIEDLSGCPAPVRDAMTDYLQFVIERTRPYATVARRLSEALKSTGGNRVVDLCSGAGGPWTGLLPELGDDVRVLLTDRYPNVAAFRQVEQASGGRISYEAAPVDATDVPEGLRGFRTLFTGFHQFPVKAARAILEDAVVKEEGIAVLEATQRKPAVLLGMLLVPLIVLLVTPFTHPFRVSRLLLTYLLPVVPLAALWDGIVSCLRTYTPDELREMVASLPDRGYTWEIGEQKVPGSAAAVTYLIGLPRSPRAG